MVYVRVISVSYICFSKVLVRVATSCWGNVYMSYGQYDG